MDNVKAMAYRNPEDRKKYYLQNKERIIKKASEARRKRLGRIEGKRKNPWDNPEYREKMKLRKSPSYWTGKKFSEETKKKMSDVRKGKVAAWNVGRKHTEEHKRKIGAALKGNQYSKGKTHTVSIETRKMLSEMRRGDKSPLWQGGLTGIQKIIRNSLEYRIWRDVIFKRDNYTCVLCGHKFIKGVTGKVILHADHYPNTFSEIRFNNNIQTLDDALSCHELWDTSNGRTLCYECHKKTPTWGGNTKFKNVELCQV